MKWSWGGGSHIMASRCDGEELPERCRHCCWCTSSAQRSSSSWAVRPRSGPRWPSTCRLVSWHRGPDCSCRCRCRRWHRHRAGLLVLLSPKSAQGIPRAFIVVRKETQRFPLPPLLGASAERKLCVSQRQELESGSQPVHGSHGELPLKRDSWLAAERLGQVAFSYQGC